MSLEIENGGEEFRKIHPIEKAFLPICMVDEAGNWVRPKFWGCTESGRPIYRAMEGRKPAFLGYDWEALHIDCPVDDLGDGCFVIAR